MGGERADRERQRLKLRECRADLVRDGHAGKGRKQFGEVRRRLSVLGILGGVEEHGEEFELDRRLGVLEPLGRARARVVRERRRA